MFCEFLGNEEEAIQDDTRTTCEKLKREVARSLQISTGVEKVGDVSRELKEFQAAFTDAPAKTNVMKYGFTLNNSRPIRMKSCPIPFALQMSLNSEIEQTLNLRVIESPYATPLIAIKKKDDSNMLCLDIHKINMLTVYEAKPNWTRMPT